MKSCKYLKLCLFLIIFTSINVHSQTENLLFQNDMLPFKISDSIGRYDINCIVLGIVEIDSLVGISYWYKAPMSTENRIFSHKVQYSTGLFLTYKKNIPINPNLTYEEVKLLFQNKDYFLIENRVGIIEKYILPRCSEENKKIIEHTLQNSHTIYDITYTLPIDTSWQYVIKNRKKKGKQIPITCFFYNEYKGKNKFLLVLMNRKWANTLIPIESDPMQEPIETDVYVKYLIPLL